MRGIYSGPIQATTLDTADGQVDIHLTPGRELDLPDHPYIQQLVDAGLLVITSAPKAKATPKPTKEN